LVGGLTPGPPEKLHIVRILYDIRHANMELTEKFLSNGAKWMSTNLAE